MANPRKFSEKIALLNQKHAEETARYEEIMKEVSMVHQNTEKTALDHLGKIQQNHEVYRPPGNMNLHERSSRLTEHSGKIRTRPGEKRHQSPYLSPPSLENWRRASSDSALNQSANEACQTNASMAHHRRGSENSPGYGGSSNDNRDYHQLNNRPKSSCDIPNINIYPSLQPPGQQIPIGNNTGSLPDLSNMHFSSPHMHPLDQEDHSSGSPYSNSPQTSSPTTLSPTSFQQAGRLSLTQDHSPPNIQQGLITDNNTSGSQQDVRITYSQQQTTISQSQPQNIPGNASPVPCQQQLAHSPGHYVYQQPHSPVAPGSPNASQTQLHQQNPHMSYDPLNSYRTPHTVNRPSPQSSPSLTLQSQGSPLSFSNNPSGPSSPTGHHGPPSMALDPGDTLFMSQVQVDLEQFTMMDSPSTTISTYINPPSHSGTYSQSDILSVNSELGSVDGGYFSTSPLQPLGYQTRTPTTTQQLTPQTPNTPTITLTDCSLGPDDRVSSDFTNDFTSSIAASFDADLFSEDDDLAHLNSLCQDDINALRQGLEPPGYDELQRLANSDMVISDPTTEADFRLEQR
ncbi:hypothetical protein QAD02_006060 [Eretmocerus hayati]|uniref:Uncharacterized protein n=1 Tax=Eretmocerus hayati TaxID=131215 RepID=A0ACC2N0Y6_9HYME|nr:hypothetical protein QAD02_006060 [Eretmocerus hayati]